MSTSEGAVSIYGSDHGPNHLVDGKAVTCAECGHPASECGPPVLVAALAVGSAREFAESDVFVAPTQADMQLIAAAPELLAMLQRVLKSGTWYGSALELDHDVDGEALEAEIVELIAKATTGGKP